MSSATYDNLIARIRKHCQQSIEDARPGSGWMRKAKNYERWYIPERKTCLVLTPAKYGQEATFAFLPATEQQIKETEQQLGFSLPPVLRLLYTQVANGGFGPGFGIIGATNGYPGVDHVPGDIVRRYQWEINFASALRQLYKGGWASLKPESRQVLWEDGIGSQELWESGQLADEEPEGETALLEEEKLPALWPDQLLPLCEHGCNITTYLFADTGQVVQGMHGPDVAIAASLEEWLESWLAGEELQLM